MQIQQPQPEAHTREAHTLATRAMVVPSSIDIGARTVDVTWSTGSDVQRHDRFTGATYIESLSMDPAHVRLGRLQSGAPVLDSHSAWSTRGVLGVVEVASITQGQGVATLRFSSRADVEPVWADVRTGILRSVSVGFVVHKWQVARGDGDRIETRTAVDWEPYEISIVPIPADAGAQMRAYNDDSTAASAVEETRTMENETEPGTAHRGESTLGAAATASIPAAATVGADEVRAAERRRVAAIDELCRVHAVDVERRAAWISEGSEINAVRAAILDGIAARQQATSIASVGDARRDQSMVRDASDALAVRSGLVVDGDGYRNFGDGSLLRIAERVLEAGGVSTRTMGRNELAQRALATSDFSTILTAVGTKLVRAGYDAMPLAHRTVFRRTASADFKAKNRPVVAGGQALEKVPESGVIPRRGASSEMASYKLDTYAGIIPITRQLLINDDFDFVASVSRQRGRAAAETERKTVWGFVNGNPNAPDGTACFHANHANTATATAGNAVSTATLAAARKALRDAKSPDGVAIGSTVRYVVCGTALETAWEQLLNGLYVPTSATSSMTPTLRTVQLLIDPLIAGEDWYAFADFDQVDTFEYAYLAGSEGPRLEQRNGFDVEGIELKVALDFGVGLIDHRGTYRMDGV